MAARNNWETFFNGHAPVYSGNVFVRNTMQEVDFLLEVLEVKPGASILDVGCGTGRHAIELARRGYVVTGLDLSAGMLEQARNAAVAAGAQVDWVQGDATNFSYPGEFDAALCLCEGSFGLLSGADDPIEQPLSILSNIGRSLKPGGKAMLTVLNAAGMLRRHSNEDVRAGRFDPLTLVEASELAPQEGLPPLALRERGFVPTELVLLGRLAGLQILHIWGGTAGNWGRRTLDLDEIEIMLVAARCT